MPIRDLNEFIDQVLEYQENLINLEKEYYRNEILNKLGSSQVKITVVNPKDGYAEYLDEKGSNILTETELKKIRKGWNDLSNDEKKSYSDKANAKGVYEMTIEIEPYSNNNETIRLCESVMESCTMELFGESFANNYKKGIITCQFKRPVKK
jgi:hypothetical protein